MHSKKTLFLTQAAVIAAIYFVLFKVFEPFGYSDVQVRIAEALTILPYFTPAAIPGVTIGCFLSNLLGPAPNVYDIVFGTLATLIASILSYKLGKNKYLVPLPPIIVNAIMIPWVIKMANSLPVSSIPVMMLTIGIGQVLSAGALGMVLLFALDKVKHFIFRND